MNKKLAYALPLALGLPFAMNATASTVSVDGTGGNTSVTVSTSNGGGTTTLSNLRTNATADVQVSAGVYMEMDDAGGGGNDIGVISAHEGGNAAFFGDTGGGSVQKNANFNPADSNTNATGVSWSGNAST